MGNQLNYDVLSRAASQVRANTYMSQALSARWKGDIETDYKKRHRRKKA